MRKLLSFLACLLCALGIGQSVTAQTRWAVTDSIVPDGYYRLVIRNGYSTANKVKSTFDWAAYMEYNTGKGTWDIGAKELATVTDDDLTSIWHLTKAGMKDGHQTYHLKNCGPQPFTYVFPHQIVIGNASYIYGTGVEQDSVYLYKMAYGSSGKATNYTQVLDREDTAPAGAVFIYNTSSKSKWRLGDDWRIKLNNKDALVNAYFELVPVDLGARAGWMKLNEALTDIKGYNYQEGENPGYVSATNNGTYLALMDLIDEASDLADAGGSDAEYTEMVAKLEKARKAMLPYIVTLDDGYFGIKDHYTTPYPAGGAKWMVPLNDLAYREYWKESGSMPGSSKDSTRRQNNFFAWLANPWFCGYDYLNDATGADVPQQFIWHVKKQADGTYTIKNCAESSFAGDSTYFIPQVILHTSEPVYDGRNYQGHIQMTGTPKSTYRFQYVSENSFRIFSNRNPFFFNQGVQHLNTTNPTNSITYALWDFVKIPESRITAKFKLNEAITDAAGLLVDWIPGTNPGYLKTSLAAPLQEAIADARAVYAKDGASDAEYTAAATAVTAAYNTLKAQLTDTAAALNPIEEGYYYIHNTDRPFRIAQGDSLSRGIYGSADGNVYWANDLESNRNNPDYVWKITPLGDDKYTVQNVGLGKYIGDGAAASDRLTLVDDKNAFQYIVGKTSLSGDTGGRKINLGKWRTEGTFIIFPESAKDFLPWHSHGHGSGAATGPDYMEIYNNPYTVYFKLDKLTDQHLLDSLLEIGAQKSRNVDMYNAINAATNALDKTVAASYNVADSLIFEASGEDSTHNQFSTNGKQASEGTYDALLDPVGNTYFQSQRTTAQGPAPEDYHYLQVDLRDKPVENFIFRWKVRGNGNPNWGKLGGTPTRYGSYDYGDNERPTEIIISATNDTTNGGTWTEIKRLDFPQDVHFRNYTSPLIQAGASYKYYRFAVPTTKVNALNGLHPYFSVAYLQMYPATVDAANSVSSYNSDVKNAADAVSALLPNARAKYAAGTVTRDELSALISATEALQALNVDTLPLVARIAEAQVLADSSYIALSEDAAQYGDVTSDQKATFLEAIAAAQAAVAPSAHPSQASLATALATLNAAYKTFNAERKTFKTNKWYYIRSTETKSYSTTEIPAWRGSQYLFVSGANAQKPYVEGKRQGKVEPVRYGLKTVVDPVDGTEYTTPKLGLSDEAYMNTANYFTGTDNPYAMWRIVETGDSTYAIQNRGTGLYLGRTQDGDWYVTQSVEAPAGGKLNLIGRNQYEYLLMDSTNVYTPAGATTPNYAPRLEPLHSQRSDNRLVWWGTGTERGYNTGSAYTFEPVDETLSELSMPALDNDTRIVTLPFALGEDAIAFDATDCKTYALGKVTVNEADSTTTLDLIEKKSFEAGEPFILVTGTGSHEAGTADSITAYVTVPASNVYATAAKTANGLVGTLGGDSIMTPGYVIFPANDVLVKLTDKATLKTTGKLSTTDAEGVYVHGGSGWIDPKLVTDPQSGTVQITGEGIVNKIKALVSDKLGKKVDVYSVDGKLLKRGVKASQATQGLGKGIYIIGKDKVSVK